MEVLILWGIIGLVLRFVSESNKNKKKQQRRADTFAPVGSNPQPKVQPAKKKGLLDSFIEQLRELEEEEKRRQQDHPKRPDAAASAKQRKKKKQQRAEPMDEEHASERFRREQDEKSRLRREEWRREDALPDANYALHQKNTFSLENLEQQFPSPAQRMVVYTEILNKPKALRKRV